MKKELSNLTKEQIELLEKEVGVDACTFFKNRILLVTVNQTVTVHSSEDEKEDFTLNAWKADFKRANNIDYIIGLRHGIIVGCYKVEGIGFRKDGRIFFSNRDVNGNKIRINSFNGLDLHKLKLKTNKAEIQYLNC